LQLCDTTLQHACALKSATNYGAQEDADERIFNKETRQFNLHKMPYSYIDTIHFTPLRGALFLLKKRNTMVHVQYNVMHTVRIIKVKATMG